MAPRVDLRPLELADSPRILAWRNSPDVRAYMYTDHVIAPDEHARWFAGIPDDAARAYWIIEMDGAPVGLANLYDIDRRNQRCAWAYYLADPSVRGLGVGSYVEYWVLEYVFEGLKLAKLWCEVLASNESVWKLHETFGFAIEARFRGHVIKEDARVDVLGLGLLAAGWRERRGAMADRLRLRGYEPPVLA
ncbi:MAG TPA: UDP-4-amino-4,6-dideoxy-N-acetyl-beta-L-altrosamine N-acetyltransferase [Caulobacteraceae bacterium]|nr:UDP-4-amino-4,6-dideoxy-N-acetyl-beta-L-altrosamine N-acetyltransferase [Caulobacteraceae bacterium]